ncbi:MAG: hypothetical protein IPM07_16840 [Anaerolineales bacterium]|nr:hypothetical protein [Anaerolineales bacterium]
MSARGDWRAGYTSRAVDALFRVALLARGRVPGDAATAASMGYRTLRQHDRRYVYHGRVCEESGWTVLQYWFFYLYNNWRSRFSGANDHEADWEMICIYLAPDAFGALQPEWVAYASHDYLGTICAVTGATPKCKKVGKHPVIYAGAGAHAAYFNAGEYLTKIELNALTPVTRALRRATGLEAADARDGGRRRAAGRRSRRANVSDSLCGLRTR